MLSVIDDDAIDEIDLWDPVNKEHSLNRGLVGWWMGLPTIGGGPSCYDLMGRSPVALTNMGNSSNGWRSNTRPGALGNAILFDGVAGYATPGAAPALEVYQRFGVFCWIKTTSANGFCVAKDFSTGARGWVLGVSAGKLYIEMNGSNQVSGIGPTINDGAWHHIGLSFDGSFAIGHIDGIYNVGSGATTTPSANSAAWVQFGRRQYVGFETYFAGLIDDVRIYGRLPTSTEIKPLYDLSRQGYPGALNRMPASAVGAASVAAVVSRIMAQNHFPSLHSWRAS